MIEPNFSPKIEAYITVLSKIQDLKLTRGIYPAEYTRQVNLEIDGIRKRLNAAAHRARTAEVIREKCEEDPEFAARWKRVKLEAAYINTFKLRRKLEDQLVAIQSDRSDQSDQSVTSEGDRHAGQD